ncbi:type II toxin-antitoxin system HicA family toxin [Lacihabitans soyangensis]|uniref:type II toxin-antitoxin system HicA family toxin n=1 Tax=Lacihabitans soyangensis TaxID=869394 RepID=UPI0020CE1FB8|nr:type II toxin-antitoxin system HicA family toxin [Lacihabitans soyangensis]
MNQSPKFLIKLLEQNGYIFKRSKGSHHVYFNPLNNKTAIVPVHGNKYIKKAHFWLF